MMVSHHIAKQLASERIAQLHRDAAARPERRRISPKRIRFAGRARTVTARSALDLRGDR
jgi:hypothetical protein